MSRGFVKETDQEEVPIIPERPPLPPGQANYVTPYGYRQLLREREELEAEIKQINRSGESETEQRIARTVVRGKLHLLQERIQSAQVLSPQDMPQEEIRFGANFQLRSLTNNKHAECFQIVGVDEADVRSRKISFTAPLARTLTGKQVGDEVELTLRGESATWRIEAISY